MDAKDSTGILWVRYTSSLKLLCNEFDGTDILYFILFLGIPDFIKQGIQAVSKFESLVKLIQKNEKDIDSMLQSIATVNLLKFPVPDATNDLPGRMNQI